MSGLPVQTLEFIIRQPLAAVCLPLFDRYFGWLPLHTLAACLCLNGHAVKCIRFYAPKKTEDDGIELEDVGSRTNTNSGSNRIPLL